MYPHRMRLRGPWQYEVLEERAGHLSGGVKPRRSGKRRSGRIRLPQSWDGTALEGFVGTVRLRRVFHAPRQLEAHERLWLVLRESGDPVEVRMNGELLAPAAVDTESLEFDVTELLAARNEVVVDVTRGKAQKPGFFEALLEVRCEAFLRRASAECVSQEGGAWLRVSGEVVGPERLAAEIDISAGPQTLGHGPVLASPAGIPFQLIIPVGPKDQHGPGQTRTPASPGGCRDTGRPSHVQVQLHAGAELLYEEDVAVRPACGQPEEAAGAPESELVNEKSEEQRDAPLRPLAKGGSVARAGPPAIGVCAQTACILEATAPKPGNVHPGAAFEDLTYQQLVLAALAIGPAMERAAELGVGRAVLDAVRASRAITGTNANLGAVLLLAPLAAAAAKTDPLDGIGSVLDRLDIDDARSVYEGIRLAQPGGLGHVPEEDIAGPPARSLVEVMRLAAERDTIARQYAHDFGDVRDGVPVLQAAWNELPWDQAVVRLHLELMARRPDTLIARKRGWAEAEESARRAAAVLEAGWPGTPAAVAWLDEFDRWLRAEGHSRNPGATADLVAACLFVALRRETIGLPSSLLRAAASAPER